MIEKTVTGIPLKYRLLNKRDGILYPLAFIALFLFILLLPASVYCSGIPVKIGVTAIRGPEEASKRWSHIADYLNASIPGHTFEIVPYDLPGLDNAVKAESVDFVITNPGSYVELESLYGATRIATMEISENGDALPVFGAVIFSRADRPDIKQLSDLKGKSFMGVDELAFGGWQMAWRELKDHGVDPYRHLKSLSFSGFPQDGVVYAVRDGRVDAGTVRTGLLENMSREGRVDIGTFRILNLQQNKNFPFLNSTRLYPEWPLAKVAHTSDELAKKVSIALLAMSSDSPAAKGAKIAGWTTPHDYNTVHECLRDLRVGPYKNYGSITPNEVLKKYWYIVLLLLFGLSVMGAVTIYVIKLNRILRESRERYRTLFDNSLDGVLLATEDGAVLDANKTACALLGYSASEISSLRREDLVDITEPRFKKFLAERYRAGSARGEITMARKDGSSLEVEVSSSVFRDAEGIPMSSIVFHDITERKELERQRADFYAMVTHDIKTPLTTILGCGLMLSEMADRLDPDTNLMVASIRSSCNKLNTLVDDFLAISSLESGKLPLKYFPCEISLTLREAVAGLEKAIQRKGLVLNMDTTEGQPLKVVIDQKLVQRAVSNLLQNAVNYTPSGGRISLGIESTRWNDEDFIVISVADTGPGIPEEEQDKVFDKYYRSSRTIDTKGTGLGLFIVKTVAKAHGGQVELTSEEGKGSTFKIILPSAPKLMQ